MKVKLTCAVCGHTLGTHMLSGPQQTVEIQPCYPCMDAIYQKSYSIVKKRAEKHRKARLEARKE